MIIQKNRTLPCTLFPRLQVIQLNFLEMDFQPDDYIQHLNIQKATARNAELRKGERPSDIKPRVQVVNEYMMHASRMKMEGHSTITTTTIGQPYYPSVVPFKNLQSINIRQLQLETQHRGFYILLRLICPPSRMQAVISIAEDEAGDAVIFSLYQQEPEVVRPADEILRENSVIIVKEPYFKVVGGGGYGIRVDHPTDVVWLADDDESIPQQWRSKAVTKAKSAEQCATEGNGLVGLGKYHEANIL